LVISCTCTEVVSGRKWVHAHTRDSRWVYSKRACICAPKCKNRDEFMLYAAQASELRGKIHALLN
jgi:hypothetical protein